MLLAHMKAQTTIIEERACILHPSVSHATTYDHMCKLALLYHPTCYETSDHALCVSMLRHQQACMARKHDATPAIMLPASPMWDASNFAQLEVA